MDALEELSEVVDALKAVKAETVPEVEEEDIDDTSAVIEDKAPLKTSVAAESNSPEPERMLQRVSSTLSQNWTKWQPLLLHKKLNTFSSPTTCLSTDKWIVMLVIGGGMNFKAEII